MILLPPDFYRPNDSVQLARALLGKILLTELDGVRTSGRIVETEAYRAPEDRASHAFGNRRTPRTEIFFAEGGHAYVYRCYGIHCLFNIGTGEAGVSHAVLVRAVEPLEGLSQQLARRRAQRPGPALTNGPGKVAQALGIGMAHYGLPLFDPQSPVRCYADDFPPLSDDQILCSPRVGVEYAGADALLPWRFRIKGRFIK